MQYAKSYDIETFYYFWVILVYFNLISHRDTFSTPNSSLYDLCGSHIKFQITHTE